VRRVFGSSSERLDRHQLELLLQLSESSKAAHEETVSLKPDANPGSPRKNGGRKERLPQDLPVVEEVLDPEPVKQKPEDWRCIGQEVSEQLDYEPARFLRRRTIRRKYVHRKDLDAVPVIAPLPERLLDRSLPAPGLLAHILVGKYCDHLPLYRQEQIFRQRHQVHLPRQTLARWVELASDWLKPIYEQIRTGVLAGGYVQMDETPIEYLEPGNGQTKQGYFWTAHRPQGESFYHWETSRAAACLENIIPANFSGKVQCDGYSGYRAFANGRKGAVELAGCWAHVRRSFTKHWNNHHAWPVGWFARFNISTGLKNTCANIEPGRDCDKRCAPAKAGRLFSAFNALWFDSKAVGDTCRRAYWARPWITP
jgi:transposase